MLRIGLTGGIGSGKTTVAHMLAELGAMVIDADEISRRLVQPGSPALDELAACFGEDIVRPDGSLNRGLLADRAFRGRTEELNRIMHPRIQAEASRQIELAAEQSVLVYDMPLLFETGQQSLVDLVLVVDIPEDLQVERAVALRGLDPEDLQRRMAAQVARAQRLAGADSVIDNSGDLDATRRQVEAFWDSLEDRQ